MQKNILILALLLTAASCFNQQGANPAGNNGANNPAGNTGSNGGNNSNTGIFGTSTFDGSDVFGQ